MSRSHRRGPWVTEEDNALLSLVATRGPNNWVQISQHMHFRSPKQCRERYHQNLKASLNHDPISAEEGERIEEMVDEMGKKWAEIARRLGNRSDNAVKNWWNGSQNRRKRNVHHHGPSPKTLTNRTHPLSAVKPPRSTMPQNLRRRSHDESLEQYNHAWQDFESANPRRRILNDQEIPEVDQAYSHEPLQSRRYRLYSSEGDAYPSPQAQEHVPLPPLRRSSPSAQIGHSLPSLAPINTSQPTPQSLASPAFPPPPYSAVSTERAPSLVSDHNSTYSISPKTWPSPRPEILAPLETNRSRWHEPTPLDRRGSAPTISSLVSLPYTGDEGYVSAIPPSASSDQKRLLPTPVVRPASYDGNYSAPHRYSTSNPNISLSPTAERSTDPQDASKARDNRMNFSSLLN